MLGKHRVALYDLDQQQFSVLAKTALYGPQDYPGQEFQPKQVTGAGWQLLAQHHALLPDAAVAGLPGLQAPPTPAKWESPATITNAMIEVTTQNGLREPAALARLLDMLAELVCKHLLVRVAAPLSLPAVAALVQKVEATNAYSLQLVLPYDEEYYSNEFGDLIIGQAKVMYTVIENSPFDKNIEDRIFFSRRALALSYAKHEGQFTPNHALFGESQGHHTYFNRKLYIGPSGELKNALETPLVCGHLQDVATTGQLQAIVDQPDFQRYWFAHKEVCTVCRDCEYRHMCVDNRVPEQAADGSWFHQQACNYDPYTAQWQPTGNG
ncbi:hypothetical protein E5J99_20025 [Hymenobacter elongatus]|uniref:Grasp-with-spasm system SPASM domain peptide maturase n=1 Tax=Hymenobacter elongatus TaxID=877208 RepID=A0A4Z0PEJ7_9BACT|nr:hypothetical protein E5J99_20025 [Hymenobacter elongatus]